MVATYAAMAGVKKVGGDYRPVRHLEIRLKVKANNPDPDNLLKNLLDGMKRAQLIVDDSPKWCEWERPIISRVESKDAEATELRISDVVSLSGPDKPAVKVAPRRLVVKCHVNLQTGKPFAERNVCLVHTGSRSLDLYETDKPLPVVRELVAWAESLGIPVDQEPPGCLSDGFEWPADGWGGIKPLPPHAKPVTASADIF
jgi:hypothetical protein